jgi:hypothetical protein
VAGAYHNDLTAQNLPYQTFVKKFEDMKEGEVDKVKGRLE